VDGCHSVWQLILAGVPQGSALGPLLFIIFIDDITENIGATIKLFADDTSLYMTVDNNMHAVTQQLNQDLNIISDWANRWLVSFNPQKTKSMVVTLKHNLLCPPLSFNNHILEDAESHKHLGIELNTTLTWKQHTESIALTTNKKINILSHLSKVLDRKTLSIMYTSFIRPSLEYGNIIWCNCTDNESDTLEAIQRRAARIITGGIIRTNTISLYLECGIETLQERRNRNVLLFFHRIVNGNVPDYLHELRPPGTMDRQRYNLRQQHNYTVPRCRLAKYKNSFFPKAINMWNSLNETLKTIVDYDAFKRELEKGKPSENPLYIIANRNENIIISRIRMNCSDLKNHLYTLKIIDNSDCQCGYNCEDSYHFFFICPLYNRPRAIFHNTIANYASFTLRTVLYGRENLQLKDNITIITATLKYIKDSQRFNQN